MGNKPKYTQKASNWRAWRPKQKKERPQPERKECIKEQHETLTEYISRVIGAGN